MPSGYWNHMGARWDKTISVCDAKDNDIANMCSAFGRYNRGKEEASPSLFLNVNDNRSDPKISFGEIFTG